MIVQGNPIAILTYIADWRTRYGCACPTAAICHDLGVTPASLELLLLRLQHQGQVRRRRTILGDRDVELAS